MIVFRTRRMKCDERKPYCQPCETPKRPCKGYRDAGPSSTGLSPHEPRISCEAPATTSPRKPRLTEIQTVRFSQLGLEILSSNHPLDSSARAVVWNHILPQLCHTKRATYAATAVLGAACEAFATPASFKSHEYHAASFPYGTALEHLQEAIASRGKDPIAPFLASLILAGVEVLHRNLTNASIHVHGALKIYTECIQDEAEISDMSRQRSITDKEYLALSAVALESDLQGVQYNLTRQAALRKLPLPLQRSNFEYESVHDEVVIMSILQDCFGFCSTAFSYKYRPPAQIPTETTEERGVRLSQLEECIERTQRLHHLLPYRAACLSTYTCVACILSPYESDFDNLNGIFQQIIDVADAALSVNLAPGSSTRLRFRLTSCFAQLLFTAAMKCRDPRIRRRATSLLLLTGREGPGDPEIFVPIARRTVEIEEQSLQEDHREVIQRRFRNRLECTILEWVVSQWTPDLQ